MFSSAGDGGGTPQVVDHSNSHFSLYYQFDLTAQDITNNQSYIQLTSAFVRTNNGTTTWSAASISWRTAAYRSTDGTLGWNNTGTSQLYNFSSSAADRHFGEIGAWIPHNPDGTCSVYFYAAVSGGSTYPYGSATATATLDLPRIPRGGHVDPTDGTWHPLIVKVDPADGTWHQGILQVDPADGSWHYGI